MITPQEIALHLQKNLPLLTDRFHDSIPVTSGSVSSGILSLVLSAGHGVSIGDLIYVNNSLIRNELIDSYDTGDNTVRYTTKDEHDLTAFMENRVGRTYPKGKSIQIDDNGTVRTLNLDPTSAGVPARNMFETDEGVPIIPITGNEYLLEDRDIGLKGFKKVTNVVGNTIEIELIDVPPVPDGIVLIDSILIDIRISIVADYKRAEEVYTKQGNNGNGEGKAYLFVIMLDREPSTDRANTDDLTSLAGSGLKMLNIRQEFAVLVLIPSEGDLGAGEEKQWVYTDLFIILNKCLYGWQETTYNGDGQTVQNTSYYGHSFEWQSRQRLDYEQGFINNDTVALRDINFKQTIFDKGDSNGSIEY